MPGFSELFIFIPLFFVALTAIISLRAFVLDAQISLKMLSGLWMFNFLVEVAGYFLRGLSPEDRLYKFMYEDHVVADVVQNQWLYNILIFVNFIVLAKIFYHVLNSDYVKVTIQFFYILFTAFVMWNTILHQGLFSYQTLTFVVGGCFVMFLSGAYYWELLVSQENEKITRYPFFWISSGLIIYYGGTIPFLGMFNYLGNNFFEFTLFYQTYIFGGFYIFLNILIITGFLCSKNFQKSLSYS